MEAILTQVQALREFRDNYLLTNPLGRLVVRCYYKVSPPIAYFISAHEAIRTVARWTLTPFVYGIKYPTWGFLLMGLVLLFVVRKIRRV